MVKRRCSTCIFMFFIFEIPKCSKRVLFGKTILKKWFGRYRTCTDYKESEFPDRPGGN